MPKNDQPHHHKERRKNLKMKRITSLACVSLLAVSVNLIAAEALYQNDFESLAVGTAPAKVDGADLSTGISCVRVSDAKRGQILVMKDSAQYPKNVWPMLTHDSTMLSKISASKWIYSADIKQDAESPVDFVIEFRSAGPKTRFTAIIANAKGELLTRGKTIAKLCTIPPGTWWTFAVTYDARNPETYQIQITDAAGAVLGETTMENPPGMGRITWLGYVGYTKADGSFYIDNIKLLPLASTPQTKAKETPKPTQLEPTFRDAKYGAHVKELMNVWQVKSEQPLGVLLNIHGGGWMGGRKAETMHKNHLNPGYHYASISYPLVNEGAVQPAMLNAALRAVQFLRYKAEEWNIDPQRIVVSGGSAGGCSSLLVALHDDVAAPKSDDLVARYSSRVAGAMVAGAQTTMNPFVIKERIGEATFGNPMPYKPFAAESAAALMANWEAHKDLVLECSPITHLSADDPPLHLFYNVKRIVPAPNSSNGIHSPVFGEIMLEACEKVGVECHLQYIEPDRPKPAISRQQFLDRLLLETK